MPSFRTSFVLSALLISSGAQAGLPETYRCSFHPRDQGGDSRRSIEIYIDPARGLIEAAVDYEKTRKPLVDLRKASNDGEIIELLSREIEQRGLSATRNNSSRETTLGFNGISETLEIIATSASGVCDSRDEATIQIKTSSAAVKDLLQKGVAALWETASPGSRDFEMEDGGITFHCWHNDTF